MIVAVAFSTGTGKVRARLTGIVKRMTSLKPAWYEIRDQFYSEEEAIFNAEGGAGGRQRWAALSPRYKAWKEKRYPGAKILHLTGAGFAGGFVDAGKGKKTKRRQFYREMRKQGLHRNSLRANLTTVRHGTWRVEALSLRIGSDIRVGKKQWYLARLHQEGTKKMPARPVFVVTQRQLSTWMNIIRDYFEDETEPAIGMEVA